MSSIQRVARAIRRQSRDSVENRAREIEYADVKRVNPLSLELHGSRMALDEEDDLTLSQWIRSYHIAVGIRKGDTLAVKQMRSGKWLVTDIVNDRRPVFRGLPIGGNPGQLLRKSTDQYGEAAWINDPVPTGAILLWPKNTAPSGWKVCNGQALAKAQFGDLFDVIGYTFGGSGANFEVPDVTAPTDLKYIIKT